jgi:hypothetical protein
VTVIHGMRQFTVTVAINLLQQPQAPIDRSNVPFCTRTMKNLASMFLLSVLLAAVVADGAAVTTTDNNKSFLLPEWTKPRTEGDSVPKVNFLTRTRVETATDENPFDWKSTSSLVPATCMCCVRVWLL